MRDLLNAVGTTLSPKVFSVIELGQQGAEHPDIGLFAANQVSKGQPKQGQLPASRVVEVEGAGDDAWLTADSALVSRYWRRYRLVLVTNTRDFVLLGEDLQGHACFTRAPASASRPRPRRLAAMRFSVSAR